MRRLTHTDVVARARLIGASVVDVEYTPGKLVTLRCDRCAYVWGKDMANLVAGKGCPRCAKNLPLTLAICRQDAERVGLTLLSTAYINTYHKLKYKCDACEHTWFTTPKRIRLGTRCPVCMTRRRGDNRRFTVQHCAAAADRVNADFLSVHYTNSKTRDLTFRCRTCTRTWMSSYGEVAGGQRCPYCPRVCKSKPEAELRAAIKTAFPDTTGPVRSILVKRKRYELDIYVPSIKAAVEFDGMYWHTLPKVKRRDRVKAQLCAAQNILLIRVKEADYRTDPAGCAKNIIDRLQQHGAAT